MGSAPLRGSAAQIFTMFPELKTLNSQKINSQIPEIKFPTRAVDSNYSAPDEDQTKKHIKKQRIGPSGLHLRIRPFSNSAKKKRPTQKLVQNFLIRLNLIPVTSG